MPQPEKLTQGDLDRAQRTMTAALEAYKEGGREACRQKLREILASYSPPSTPPADGDSSTTPHPS